MSEDGFYNVIEVENGCLLRRKEYLLSALAMVGLGGERSRFPTAVLIGCFAIVILIYDF